MSEERFVNCGKISYSLTNMLLRAEAFGRVPIKLRLLFAMMEDADTQGVLRRSLSKVAMSMGPVVNMGRIYKIRDQLWIEDFIRRDGNTYMINPRLFSKGSLRNNRWNMVLKLYETMPKYRYTGGDNEQAECDKAKK